MKLVVTCFDFKLNNQPDVLPKSSCYHPPNMICKVTVHQSLVESLSEKVGSNNRSFLGVSACQLQAICHKIWGVGGKTRQLICQGGHHTETLGISEMLEVYMGKVLQHVHLWVAEGPVQFILGKPFLTDASAHIT
ncbi:uncharacterized protein VP01_61g7 [Puccinia sorghi]|uniref:Uncharacterized protein n=1 Tax=Puccinia sorghi TaxID=27349 RepID=A0A0L6UGM5_9BASI|nr:uncharacterized protein VP01_61g7 [Puccinia sorghi]